MKNKLLGVIAIVAVMALLAGCASMTLVSLEQDTIEGPAQVRQGQDIDPGSITVWGIYKDDSRKTVSVRASDITFDKNTVGSQTVRVRRSGQEASFQTQVMALVSVSISSPPSTLIYKVGQTASWNGLAVQGVWDQMGSQDIPASSVQITGYNNTRAGTQSITVSYLGKTASFNVSVVAMTALRVTQNPTKVDYAQGESLNLAGLQVVGVWQGLPEEQVSIAANEVIGYNADTPGVQRLTVNKNGITTTFNVEVLRLTGITIDQPPDKTDYAVGEQLNLAGIVVNGNYSGTASKRMTQAIPVAQLTASGFNSGAVARQQRVTVTVGSQTANFFVNIDAASAATAPAATTPATTTPAAGTFNPATNQPAPTGTWRLVQGSGSNSMTTTYTFNANGTGMWSMASGTTSVVSELKWTTSGNRLTILMSPGGIDGTPVTYTYSISGNTLTWQGDGWNFTVTYTR